MTKPLNYEQEMRVRIRTLRKSHHPPLSQQDLADECGVELDQWKKWEHRGYVPDWLKTVVCRKLGISAEFFLDGFEQKVSRTRSRRTQ